MKWSSESAALNSPHPFSQLTIAVLHCSSRPLSRTHTTVNCFGAGLLLCKLDHLTDPG